jgi:proton-translocating NAD(P)+ transhydrogenase subunit alpha
VSAELLAQFTVLVLAAVIGFELISRVPSLLHTPLMSATNAIHGVVLVGAMVVLLGPGSTLTTILGLIAVVLASINVVGGFVVTGRMLEMFKARGPRRR